MKLTKNKNFYVYCHQTKDDGKCFYIGKGKGDRAYRSTSRNPHWKRKVAKHGGFDAVILVNNITEEKAFELEKDFIRQIGRENLVNMTDGGDGPSGYKPTEETRKKQSDSRIGKYTGDKHPNYGKLGKDNHRSKSVSQYTKDGEFIKTWDSMMDIQRELGIKSSRICRCCRGIKKSAGGFIWKYIDDDSNASYVKIINCKKVNQYTKNGEFVRSWDSITDASRELKIDNGSITRCCKGVLKSTGGFLWRYFNDDGVVEYIIKNNTKKVNQYSKDGEFIKTWNSMMDIERELGIKNSGISMCCSDKLKSAGGFIFQFYG